MRDTKAIFRCERFSDLIDISVTFTICLVYSFISGDTTVILKTSTFSDESDVAVTPKS